MLASTHADGLIFRVGYTPDPWAWVPWQYADRSTGRWDDPRSTYRVLYVGGSPEACFVEVLAQFRPDPRLVDEVGAIAFDPRDDLHPTSAAGVVPSTWLERRLLGSAHLSGSFVDVTHKDSIATLRPVFLSRAIDHGLPDFDAATIRLHEPRRLTQGISRYLYEAEQNGEECAGIAYESRFGAGLMLYAIFERSGDGDRSRLLEPTREATIGSDNGALRAALELHGLELQER